jgi:hypothetical protein
VHEFASFFETLEPMKTQQRAGLERAVDRYYREYLQAMNLAVAS